MVGNLVLRRHGSRAVKRDLRRYIRPYTSSNENFEYGYPHSNALLQFCLKLERCKSHRAARHPTKCDVSNYFRLRYTVANFLRYPIRCLVTKSSALESQFYVQNVVYLVQCESNYIKIAEIQIWASSRDNHAYGICVKSL